MKPRAASAVEKRPAVTEAYNSLSEYARHLVAFDDETATEHERKVLAALAKQDAEAGPPADDDDDA